MNNIFENAKFGDIYISKDGSRNSFCSFTKSGSDTLTKLYREGWGVVIFYLDGQVHSGVVFGKRIDFTIVGKWQEPINEEELDKLIVIKCQWKDYYDYRIVTTDGKGHVRVSFFSDEVCISDLYVDESCRCQGIGTKLLNKVDELLNGRKATIVPLEDWEAEWYKRRGYVVKIW